MDREFPIGVLPRCKPGHFAFWISEQLFFHEMENYEGWHPWPEGEDYTPIQKIGGVKVSNHRITSYLILNPPEKRWVTREEAINLAEKHLLRAVVVHSKRYTYLRPFPHETPYKNLIC